MPHRAEEMTATFAGPPLAQPAMRLAQAMKKSADAGGLQEGAEDDEQDDKGGTDTDGGADDTSGGIEQVVDDGFQRFPRHKGVDDKAAGHAEDGQAHHTAAALRQNQDADDAQHDLQIGDAGGTLEDALIIDNEIEKAASADQC